MKTNGNKVPHINLAARWRQVVSYRSRMLCPHGKHHLLPI